MTQQKLIENGITTAGDLFNNTIDLVEMPAFAGAGGLKIRASLYLSYNGPCGDVPTDLGNWYQLHAPTRGFGELLRIGGVKIFVDGGSCNRDARSYELTPGGGFGNLYFTVAELVAVIGNGHDRGYQVALHSIGDRAVDTAQQALSVVLGGGLNTLRHRRNTTA
ncbi:MAG: amidohydrolase family protein [Gammaproteobacteria bacterium]|nr:amidohydrolase family protein [Gammaproteobacteria bacterium]MDH3468181.1 amidohydrolase family protein [Gammaproteobacteria bacterium]